MTLDFDQRSMWFNVLFADGIMIMSCFVGLIAFAKYFDCDPFSSGVNHFSFFDEMKNCYKIFVTEGSKARSGYSAICPGNGWSFAWINRPFCSWSIQCCAKVRKAT